MDITKLTDGVKLVLNAKLVCVVVIASSALLFAPPNLLSRLGLGDLQVTWRPWAGGIWVLASAGLLVHIGAWVHALYVAYRERQHRHSRLHNLGSDEKELLRDYFAQDTHSLRIDIQSETALTLLSCGILLYCATPGGVLIGSPGSLVIRGTFAIAEDAWHYLQKHPELENG